jgi:hypothetical protein
VAGASNLDSTAIDAARLYIHGQTAGRHKVDVIAGACKKKGVLMNWPSII